MSFYNNNFTWNERWTLQKAMKRGEVIIAVMADYSKAFDTVAYEVVLSNSHELGFSKSSLRWIVSYLTERR